MSEDVMTSCTQCGRLMTEPGGYLCDHMRYRPTQETDPKDNARCPSCRCAEGDGSPCPDIDCPDRWHAEETDPG